MERIARQVDCLEEHVGKLEEKVGNMVGDIKLLTIRCNDLQSRCRGLFLFALVLAGVLLITLFQIFK